MTISNIPDFSVTLDGKDLTTQMRPRLLSLTLTEKRGDEADQLDLTLDDADGRLPLPRMGAVLHVKLGWKQGSGVKVGLFDKGSFIVDEIEHSGPPDVVTVRARSADFTTDLRTRREHSWHDATIGEVVADIASRNGLTSCCAPVLAEITVPIVAQSRESDMALLRRLGRAHDAVATIKRGALIFTSVGSGQNAAGAALSTLTLRRAEGDRHTYRIEKREEADGVTASYHDRDTAERKDVTVGKEATAKKLSHVYASKFDAERAAKSTMRRAQRQPVSMTMALALGRADICPEQKASVSGYKTEINETAWLVSEVTHTLSDRGYGTAMKLESAP